jgi:hypothetical protein
LNDLLGKYGAPRSLLIIGVDINVWLRQLKQIEHWRPCQQLNPFNQTVCNASKKNKYVSQWCTTSTSPEEIKGNFFIKQ